MVNVLVVSYGAREAAMVDALYRSKADDFHIYVADKQANPFNREIARRTGGRHAVIPALGVDEIYHFASEIPDLGFGFVLVGPEAPIINGLADRIESDLNVPVLAPWKQYAIEGSKAAQRDLIASTAPEANPLYRVFPRGSSDGAQGFMEGFGYQVVIKPSSPAAGKGVVVHGDHFNSPEEAMRLFEERVGVGDVVVEEKLDGEESSLMVWSDGQELAFLPDVRDYKRAFDGDKGPNTGGMGSYMDSSACLPFMNNGDRNEEERIAGSLFAEMSGNGFNIQLKGMPLYLAFMHTRDGPKILEINSRPGDPEIMCVLPAMETDFGELCLDMATGALGDVKMSGNASVVTYLVPETYGGRAPSWKGSRRLKMNGLREMMFDPSAGLRVYPGSMESRNGNVYMLSSRTIAIVGTAQTIELAREISTEAAEQIRAENPQLWRRTDIASAEYIQSSIDHMRRLRE